jgi:hypothetical protein
LVLSTLLSDSLSVCSSINARKQVTSSYRTPNLKTTLEIYTYKQRDAYGSLVVKVLCYKPQGRKFETG